MPSRYDAGVMASRRASVGAAQLVVRVAVAVAVLACFFAVHCATSHAPERMGSIPHALVSPAVEVVHENEAADPGANLNHAMTDDIRVVAVAVGSAGAASVGAAEHAKVGMSTAALCVAVLVMGLGALTLWLRRRGALQPALVLPRLTPHVNGSGRDPDPPSLQHLSIQRC